MPRLYLSAAHKSSGKTTLAIGLCAALARRGYRVRPFKKGPDYIDPMWLSAAAGQACLNLDFNTMSPEEICGALETRVADQDIALVEGNKGLHDGVDLEGGDSNAALARLLRTPVVLVIDCRGTTRGVAPLLLGYQSFDPLTTIAGVIFNQTGGARHVHKLRAAVEHYTDLPVLGAVGRNPALAITQRHLGLVPTVEAGIAAERVGRLAQVVESSVDIDGLLRLAGTARASCASPAVCESAPLSPGLTVRLGVVRDSAFGFHYADDLDALRAAGAELVFIDALHDRRLPALDGLFIAGGFPETHLSELQANVELRRAIRDFVAQDRPVYAECGGLMYLCRTIEWRGRRAQMVGALQADCVVQDTPVGKGYVRLNETPEALWGAPGSERSAIIRAHEFHYSRLVNVDPETRYAYRVLRGSGIDGRHDGIVQRKLLASYAHLRDTASNRWTRRFVAYLRAERMRRFGMPTALRQSV